MVGFCHLTDSHHNHHGQKPTMVGICHGGNMPLGLLHSVRHVESIKNFMSAPITTAYDILVEENSTEVIHSICQLPPWSSPPGCPCRPGCH